MVSPKISLFGKMQRGRSPSFELLQLDMYGHVFLVIESLLFIIVCNVVEIEHPPPPPVKQISFFERHYNENTCIVIVFMLCTEIVEEALQEEDRRPIPLGQGKENYPSLHQMVYPEIETP